MIHFVHVCGRTKHQYLLFLFLIFLIFLQNVLAVDRSDRILECGRSDADRNIALVLTLLIANVDNERASDTP